MTVVATMGEVLQKVTRPVDLDDVGDFPLVGVRWHGLGAFLREMKPGRNIKKKRHYQLATGDITYNKLFAWKGAFAIIEPHLDGAYVSDKFPLYRLASTHILPEYLKLVFRSPLLARQAESRSVGSAAVSKFTLNPSRFLELQFQCPSLPRQLEVIRHADELDRLAAQVSRRCNAATESLQRLLPAFVESATHSWPRKRLGDVGKLLRRSVTIQDDIIYRQLTIAMNNRGVRLRGEKPGYEIAVKNQSVVAANDIVFSRIDIRNGAIGRVASDLSGAVVANDFPVYVFDAGTRPDYGDLVFRTPSFREQCISGSAGSTNRRKMRRDRFLELEIPYCSESEQAALVEAAREVANTVTEGQAACERIAKECKAIELAMLETLCDVGDTLSVR